MQKRTLLSNWIKQPKTKPDSSNISTDSIEVDSANESFDEPTVNKPSPPPPNEIKPKVNRKASLKEWSSIFKPQNRFIVSLKLPGYSERHYNIQNMPISDAPFKTCHVNNNCDFISKKQHPKLKKRVKSNFDDHNLNIITSESTLKLPDSIKPELSHKYGQREILGTKEIHEILLSQNIDEPVSQNCFDKGEFETQMWDKKYIPPSPSLHFNPVQTSLLREWIALKFAGHHDQEEIMILNGPTASGKTAAVYAACNDTNSYVFEVNTSNKRTGKNLNSLLEGIAHNHSVHHSKKVVVLIDEADIVFENEAGSFWPFILKFSKSSKRPIIITCQDRNIFKNFPLDTTHKLLYFAPPPTEPIARIAWKICIHEGHIVEYSDIYNLTIQLNNDLRKILSTVQFWCQMGVQDKSGQVWAPKQHEIENGDRIVSRGTYLPLDLIANKSNDPLSEPVNSDLYEVMSDLETLSLSNLPKRDMSTTRTNPDDMLFGLDELKITEFYSDMMNDMGRAYRKIAILETEHNPYLRKMAVHDYMRQMQIKTLIEKNSNHSVRLLKRAWASAGLDTRSHLGLQTNGLEQILSKCYKSKFYQ